MNMQSSVQKKKYQVFDYTCRVNDPVLLSNIVLTVVNINCSVFFYRIFVLLMYDIWR